MMQLKLSILLLIFCFLGIPRPDSEMSKNESIIFEGTVLTLAPEPAWVSGITAVYRLAKYRVEHVCTGQYTGNEIVVDHLVLTGKELQDLRVGDKVCVSVTKSNKIFSRYYADGIRETSEEVKVFYLGGKVELAKKSSCDCQKKRRKD